MFISYDYDYDNDKRHKNMLLAWDKNSEFDFGFNDQSADVSIQSTDAAAIKRAISAKINAATNFLCLVGEKTSKRTWVSWEIDNACELKKRLAAVKISSGNTTPSGLLGAGASWAMSFTFDSIEKALEGA
ncbi:MAG: TIR domain-containing protein [Planctomycetes bacterium]|nr:TIR domain-containing protein [Planctomycetota bacterium]